MQPFETIIETSFDDYKIIPFSKVTFDQEVRTLCEQNMCGCYGKSWTCPPAIDDIETLQSRLAAFSQCFVFYTVYQLEDSFDWEGMMSSVKDFQSRILKSKKKIQDQEQNQEFLFLGAGSCQLCETCTYPEEKPCRNPEDAIFSVESFGIDATKLMQENGLKYNNGANTVTYIGVLFFSA